MTLDEFAITTKRIISNNGFEDYLPTAIYPARCHIKTLVGLPQGIEPEAPVMKWAVEDARDGEEFLVAFKVDKSRFKVIRCVGPYAEDEIYSID